MLTNHEKNRYNRHLVIDGFDETHQLKLKNARVLIVGLGGLGSPVATYLNAAGVGTLGIIDHDYVSLSNLQRQVLFYEEDIDVNKADIIKKRLNKQNSKTKITVYNKRFTKDNSLEIAKNYDIIVDCTDNFEARFVIDEASKNLNIPFVYGSIEGFKGQVSIFNYKKKMSYSDLFTGVPKKDDNEIIGVIGTTPGIIGSIQANETIKIIIGIGDILDAKLLQIDTEILSFEIFDIS